MPSAACCCVIALSADNLEIILRRIDDLFIMIVTPLNMANIIQLVCFNSKYLEIALDMSLFYEIEVNSSAGAFSLAFATLLICHICRVVLRGFAFLAKCFVSSSFSYLQFKSCSPRLRQPPQILRQCCIRNH